MDILTAIRERHSSRAVLARDVEDNILEQILDAARHALSEALATPDSASATPLKKQLYPQ